MKKCCPFLMCLFVALSTFLLSCGGDSDANRCKITVAATTGGKVKISKYLKTSENVLIDSEIEVVATPGKGYTFTGWYVGNSSEPVSTDAVYAFIATKNSTLTAHFANNSNTINGHKYVDLGLPSGLKWATCNVGAIFPWEDGGYYAWGETKEKSNYDLSTYKWCRGSYGNMTKYCTDRDYGRVDNKTTLASKDDVAHVKWGGTWRMPTKAEQDELRNKCTWTWTTQRGVNGYKVTSKKNGNSIFLPAAGERIGSFLSNSGSSGYYWSSSLYESSSNYAYGLSFNSGRYDWYYYCRYNGQSVRPVSE